MIEDQITVTAYINTLMVFIETLVVQCGEIMIIIIVITAVIASTIEGIVIIIIVIAAIIATIINVIRTRKSTTGCLCVFLFIS